jgi:serine/threonine-protein kinase
LSDDGSSDPGRTGTIRLQLLGPVGLWSADGRELRAVLQQPKRLALLAYLTLAPRSGFLRRDTILGAFWPELDQDHARNALRQALHFLRSALGPEVIENRGDEELGVRPGSLWCDAAAFQAAVESGRLQDALDLYRNDLLPGFFVAEAPEFERWVELERERLRRLAVGAAWRMAETADAADSEAAVHWARRAVSFTPEDEAAIQRLLGFLVRRGDRAGALRAYAAFRRRLEAEYGLQPSAETRALVQEIRHADGDAERESEDGPPGDRIGADAGRRTPVVPDVESGPVSPDAHESPDEAGLSRTAGASVPARPSSRQPSTRRPAVAAFAVLAVAAAGISIVLLTRADRRALPVADLVVVSPFEVLDDRFDVWGEGLMSVLSANLDGAGPLRTVSPTVAVSRWDGGFDRESAIRLGRATQAATAVTGRLIGAGADSVRIVALLVDPAKGEQIGAIEVRGTGDRIDRLTDSLTVALLREMGRTRAIGAVRLAAIGSRALPALKAFLRGDQFYRRTQWDSALASYRQAVELDSTFAPAIRRIGNVLMWQGTAGGDVARDYHERAGRFNHGLAPRDSLLVLADSLGSALYGFDADPEWWAHARRHAATLAEASRRYPDDPEVWNALGESGFHFRTVTGITTAELLMAFDRAILLDSSFAPAYLHPISLAMTGGDSARALRYARAYLRRAQGDVTARGVALFVRVVERGGLAESDSAEYASRSEPAELFEAWAPLSDLSDSAEAGVRIARWLAARRWAAPMPFADPAFNRRLYARSLATRGHVREAYAVSGSSDPGLFAELAWLGVVPEAEARTRFNVWLEAGDASAARGGLPWWAARRDTPAIAGFIRIRAASAAQPAPSRLPSADRVRRDRALYDMAAGRAWLALARGDTMAALDLFLEVPDSLCPGCYLHRLPRAELLLRAGRTAEARVLLDRELTAIVGGPRPLEIRWRLLRAEAAERTGQTALAIATYRNVLDMWRAADPLLRAFVEHARAGLERAATARSLP